MHHWGGASWLATKKAVVAELAISRSTLYYRKKIPPIIGKEPFAKANKYLSDKRLSHKETGFSKSVRFKMIAFL